MPLGLRDVEIGYGKKTVVRDVSLAIGEREIVALIGHNGAGKTTLLNGIFGVLPLRGGEITWDGRPIGNRRPAANLRDGIAYSPQGAQVYRTLSVAENLALGAFALKDRSRAPANIRKVYDLFPVLHERRDRPAGVLSGGERQMLCIGALLVVAPRLALLDEPSGGLAPLLVERVFAGIRRIVDEFATSILLVEQNLQQAFSIADRAYVMTSGTVTLEGTPAELEASAKLGERYFSAAPVGAASAAVPGETGRHR